MADIPASDFAASLVARYRRLREQINDQQLHEVADRLTAKLEAERLALHPKK